MKSAQLVKSGYQHKEIASLSNISIATVKAHIRGVRKKLGLRKNSISLKTFLNTRFLVDERE